jgi:hypothetical protein
MDDAVPWDAEAIRLIVDIERSLDSLGLDVNGRGEFSALLNAIEFQVDACRPTQAVIAHVSAAIVALAHERGLSHRWPNLPVQLERVQMRLFGSHETR